MKQHLPGPWITLNTSYYIAPVCHPAKLLDDAELLLGGAHGITQSLADLLRQDGDASPADLADALWGAALLVEMGRRNAHEAQCRLSRIRGAMREVDEDEVAES